MMKENDAKPTNVTLSIHIYLKWEYVKLFDRYLEGWAATCKKFPGHLSTAHIQISDTERVVIHGFSDYMAMDAFVNDPITVVRSLAAPCAHALFSSVVGIHQ